MYFCTDRWLGKGCWYSWLSDQVSFLHLGVALYYHFILFFTVVAGFGIRREYEDSGSDLIDMV